MLEINKQFEKNELELKRKMQKQKEKQNQTMQSMDHQKAEYEKKMTEILGSRHEEKLDLTNYYNNQIEYLQAELKTSHTIRGILDKNNNKLKSEIETLAKIVKTSRNHFKELELTDFEGL